MKRGVARPVLPASFGRRVLFSVSTPLVLVFVRVAHVSALSARLKAEHVPGLRSPPEMGAGIASVCSSAIVRRRILSSPPVWRSVGLARPRRGVGLISWIHDAWFVHVADLIVDSFDISIRQFLELVAVEPRETMNLFLRQPDNERVAIVVNLDSPNRHEELFRFEPAAGVHDEIIGPARFGIDDESIDVSEFLVGTVPYKHVVDVQGLIVNLVRFDVSQPRLWMIHGFSPICAMRGKRESKTRASPRPAHPYRVLVILAV